MIQKKKQDGHPFLKAKGPSNASVSSELPNIQNAIALHQRGQLGQAQAIYKKLLDGDSKNADALHLLGVISYQTGNHQAAVELISLAIKVKPNFSSYYSNLGIALKELKQFDAAVANYDNAIALNPNYAEAYSNRGNALKELKKLEDALASYEKAIFLKPDYADAYCNRGIVLKELNQLDDSLTSYDKAIEIKPDFAEAYSNRGVALQELRQLEAALASYEKAISLKPNYSEAYFNQGNALKELKQFTAAVISYNQAIFLNPDDAEAYTNRGVALQELKQFEAAVSSYDMAISLKPGDADAYTNRGVALQELKQLEAAIASYDMAISLKPDNVDAYWNKSLLLLLIGEYLEGLKLYERRWDQKDIIKFKRNFTQPLWLGEDLLLNKVILIHAEQGLGDTLHFCRYVKMVADLGAKVVLEVQKPLLRLLKHLPGVSTLIANGDPLPEFDFQCPLLSLPLAFKTELKTIPATRSYLQAEPQRVAQWKSRLQSDRLKIGIGWQGSQGSKIDIGRSFELKLFENIAALPNVQLISLQKGYGSEQLKSMPQGMRVTDLGDELDADGAFLDSAAVMMNLDLVITSDTALAHLAGALGVRTWVVLKYVPDWRWMLERDDSPWYPSIKLYRQEKMDDWAEVFARIQMDLTSRLH